MFEDQQGTFDWYKQHVGKVQHAAFHGVKPRVCVSTEQSVLGCLLLRDGSPAWRKRLQEPPVMAHVEQNNYLVTIERGVAKAYDFEGFLKWEAPVHARAGQPSSAPSLVVPLPELHGQSKTSAKHKAASLVVADGYAQVLGVLKGDVLARHAAPSLGTKEFLLAARPAAPAAEAAPGAALAVLIGYSAGDSDVEMLLVSEPADSSSGSPYAWSQLRIASPQPLSRVASSAQGMVAVLSQDHAHVCHMRVTAGGQPPEALVCTSLAEAAAAAGGAGGAAVAAAMAGGAGGLRLQALSSGVLLVSHTPGLPGALLLTVAADGAALQPQQSWADVSAASVPVVSDKGEVVGLVAVSAAGAATLRVVSAASGATVLQEAAAPKAAGLERSTADSTAPWVTGAFLGTYRKKDRTDGYRLLLVWSDARLALLQQGVVVWARDEALASVTSSLFVDLPAPRGEASQQAAALADGQKLDFKTRLRAQVLGAKVQLKLNTPEEAAELTTLRDALSDKTRPTRDVNGFRKMLVVTTAAGKVAALHNGDGRVLWQRSYPPGQAPYRALVWKVYHDISHAPQVLLLHRGAGGPFATVINAHTGAQLQRVDLPFTPDKVVSLHQHLHDGTAEQAVYLLVQPAAERPAADAAPLVHLLPHDQQARSYVALHARSVYLWEEAPAGAQAPALRGYTFGAAAIQALNATPSSSSSSSSVSLTPAWQLVLPEPILIATARDASEPIQSSVKVLSDRSIKHRYLNPNTIFVATGALPGAGDEEDLSGLTALLVDAATGHVLHRQVHSGGRAPVAAVFSENMVLMTYWDSHAVRYVASSMELYNANPPPFSVLDYLFNPNATLPTTSFNATPVEVLMQVFWVSGYQPRSLVVTRTEQGITLKQILVTTHSDQVYALDPRWVNPRRPKKAKLSAEEQEEQLIPYQENLPMSFNLYATLDKQVLGLAAVSVEPSRLESTCHVFVRGVDLFYTRLSPARAYDALEDDFNYVLLVVALLALAAGSLAMHYAVQKSAIKQKWA